MHILLATLVLLAAPARIGLYPLSLPDGQAQLADRLAAQIHEGASVLPGVRAFDLVPHSACAADEVACLAAAARHAQLDAMISAAVSASDAGYRFQLREASAAGALLHESRGEVRGGPLDLAGALEHGVCEMLGGAPCEGELAVTCTSCTTRTTAGRPSLPAGGVHVFVDGQDRGPLPMTLPIAVGRHVVRVGEAERRIRVSYARTARLTAEQRAGALALIDAADAAPAAPLEAVVATAEVVSRPRATAARVLVASGIALLASAGGVALYSNVVPSGSRSAAIAASALAATGAGAIVAGGLLVALTPSGIALHGEF